MKKPSFRVTLLLVLVLSLTAWNALRVWTALAWHTTLTEFAGAQISKVITVSGAAWTLTGIIVTWSFLQGKTWAPKLLITAAAAYSVWFWVERSIWQNPRPNWLFAVIVNLGLLIFILFTTKSLSREAYERKIENPKVK